MTKTNISRPVFQFILKALYLSAPISWSPAACDAFYFSLGDGVSRQKIVFPLCHSPGNRKMPYLIILEHQHCCNVGLGNFPGWKVGGRLCLRVLRFTPFALSKNHLPFPQSSLFPSSISLSLFLSRPLIFLPCCFAPENCAAEATSRVDTKSSDAGRTVITSELKVLFQGMLDRCSWGLLGFSAGAYLLPALRHSLAGAVW